MNKPSLTRKLVKTLGVFTLVAGLIAAHVVYKDKTLPPLLLLDIQAGEPLGDAMSRSTMKQDLPIALDMQNLRLPVLMDWGSTRYQVRLQGGEGKSVLFKWTPVAGTIWSYTGWIDEVDLDFTNYHLTRA